MRGTRTPSWPFAPKLGVRRYSWLDGRRRKSALPSQHLLPTFSARFIASRLQITPPTLFSSNHAKGAFRASAYVRRVREARKRTGPGSGSDWRPVSGDCGLAWPSHRRLLRLESAFLLLLIKLSARFCLSHNLSGFYCFPSLALFWGIKPEQRAPRDGRGQLTFGSQSRAKKFKETTSEGPTACLASHSL